MVLRGFLRFKVLCLVYRIRCEYGIHARVPLNRKISFRRRSLERQLPYPNSPFSLTIFQRCLYHCRLIIVTLLAPRLEAK